MEISDAGVCHKGGTEYAARESVNAVYDAARIQSECHQYKKRNNERAEHERAVAGNTDGNDAEFRIEPPSDEQRYKRNEQKPSAQPYAPLA